MLFEEGPDRAIRRHSLLVETTRHAVDRRADAGALPFNIVRAEERANSVTTVLVQGRERHEAGEQECALGSRGQSYVPHPG